MRLCSNGDLDLDTSLNIDNDLLDNLSWRIETIVLVSFYSSYTLFWLIEYPTGHGVNLLNQALVNAHLKHIPSLGTLSVGGLPCGDLQVLGWQTDGALNAQVLGLCPVN